jgi:hypothetical protein
MLEKRKAPERPGRRIEYFDDTVSGFGARVTRDPRALDTSGEAA